MSGDFKFDDDDFGGFDQGIDDSDFGSFGSTEESNEGGFGNFEDTSKSNNLDNVPSDKKAVMKPAIIAIALGAVVIIGGFVAMKFIQNKATNTQNNTNQQVVQEEQPVQQQQQADTIQQQQQQQQADKVQQQADKVQETTNKTIANGNNINDTIDNNVNQKNAQGWKSFAVNDKISFNADYVDCIFTVTSVKNYVKVIDSESNLMMKTTVTGNLSGFTGTYELELPYSKGSQLLVGNNFNVKVQVGKYDDKVVVGEIKY